MNMLIIGKRINTVRKRVLQAYQEKDNNYIREEAICQAKAGESLLKSDFCYIAVFSHVVSGYSWALGIITIFLRDTRSVYL